MDKTCSVSQGRPGGCSPWNKWLRLGGAAKWINQRSWSSPGKLKEKDAEPSAGGWRGAGAWAFQNLPSAWGPAHMCRRQGRGLTHGAEEGPDILKERGGP